MILTVTLNPLLERRYSFNSVHFNSANRSGIRSLEAGGKAINVSRQLKRLGVRNIALTFTGGVNGKLFKEILKKEGISFSDIHTKEETRDAALIIDISAKKVTTFFSNNISVTETEKNLFVAQMEKMIQNSEMVIFSGSSPCKATDSVFAVGIEYANKLDKISVCDTYGESLKNCIEASPTILHNNTVEVESSLNIPLKTKSEKLSLLDLFYSKGIKQAFITDGGNPFYSSNFDFHYKVTVPKIDVLDSTGSGDSFVAGIAYGWHNKLTFEQQLAFASALGVCNAKTFDTCEVDRSDAEILSQSVYIEPVGKKLKQIHDEPD